MAAQCWWCLARWLCEGWISRIWCFAGLTIVLQYPGQFWVATTSDGKTVHDRKCAQY